MILVPRRFLTVLNLYRILTAVPPGMRVRVTDIRDGYVFWERLP